MVFFVLILVVIFSLLLIFQSSESKEKRILQKGELKNTLEEIDAGNDIFLEEKEHKVKNPLTARLYYIKCTIKYFDEDDDGDHNNKVSKVAASLQSFTINKENIYDISASIRGVFDEDDWGDESWEELQLRDIEDITLQNGTILSTYEDIIDYFIEYSRNKKNEKKVEDTRSTLRKEPVVKVLQYTLNTKVASPDKDLDTLKEVLEEHLLKCSKHISEPRAGYLSKDILQPLLNEKSSISLASFKQNIAYISKNHERFDSFLELIKTMLSSTEGSINERNSREILFYLEERFSPKKKKPQRTRIWTKERCANEAKSFNTRNEFKKGATGAYKAAWSQGWLDEICFHMKPARNSFKQVESAPMNQ